MNLIVIDLEWNTATRSQKADSWPAAGMMFEIIEIGAVQMKDGFQTGGHFHRYVKPVVYKRIQYHIAAVTKRTQQSLKNGVLFPQAADELIRFTGENPVLVSWGTADPEVLISNFQFHEKCGEFRFLALNAQAFFSGFAEGVSAGEQRSVEYALDYLNLPKDLPFHEALSDAVYAARILGRTLEQELAKQPDATVETLIRPYVYDPFLTRQREDRIELEKGGDLLTALKNRAFVCPACQKELRLLPASGGCGWQNVKPDKIW
ncbi:MAG TPA: 3'-5' exonuclease, partial [Bacillota bacterium]|nr:3'-5' exonuclease [Bacillota bacterium]